jgi:hypothetical protein
LGWLIGSGEGPDFKSQYGKKKKKEDPKTPVKG